MWGICVTIVTIATQQCTMCVVELYVTVNCIQILTVEQQCIYDKFISPATMKGTQVSIYCIVPKAAMQQKIVRSGLYLEVQYGQTDRNGRTVVAQFLGSCVAVKHFRRSEGIIQL